MQHLFYFPSFFIYIGKFFFGIDSIRSKSAIYFILIASVALNAQSSSYQRAEYLFGQQQFADAQSIFEAFLAQNPDDKKTQEYLGDIAAHKQQWDKAISYYEILSSKEDQNANYHFKLGAALAMKAKILPRWKAITFIGRIKRELEHAAILNPNHIEARWALIELYIQLPEILGGSQKKAMGYANELASISAVDGYLVKGHIFEHYKHWEEAETFYKEAVVVGGSIHTYNKLIDFYIKWKLPLKAISLALDAVKRFDENNFNYRIGEITAVFNTQPHLGIEHLGKYVANYSIDNMVAKEWAFYRLAQINRNVGNKQLALTWIIKALQQKPDFKEAGLEKSDIMGL